MDSPSFPSFPQFPSTPKLPSVPSPGNLPSHPGQVSNQSLAGTFSNMLQQVSDQIQTPNQMAKDMFSGKKEYDSTELMMSMLNAEQQLNMTIRVINQVVNGIRQLETIQV
ncbi:MAG: flagellar hook-basal body complex protein FliE [Candidatus Caenarcaniphilales bacterium]|nr:flagellar hook-basal body complex protein FliE [Candidatus Caenarcaniphilales bacterium]